MGHGRMTFGTAPTALSTPCDNAIVFADIVADFCPVLCLSGMHKRTYVRFICTSQRFAI